MDVQLDKDKRVESENTKAQEETASFPKYPSSGIRHSPYPLRMPHEP